MKIKINSMVGILLLATSVPMATAQTKTDNSNLKPEYKAGQVWTMNQGITVTALAVEDVHRSG